MKHVKPFLVAVALTVTASAIAQQAPKPENIIKWRQSVYQVLAWNSGRIKANVDGQFNREEVVRAANSTAAIANSGLGALYAPGTEQGKGWHDTAAKPEIFKDGKKVGDLAGNFVREANELAKIAANGDQAAVKAQFGKLGQTCKACHDDYKVKD
ncbi:MAG: cytochrome c [Dechloromonas sp.]|uniref:c-type cytochrome n=1 Tax=Dechloromonas sp. TaxID=1917218 RepID=UPI0027EBA711|nr:cytochrome c [Dechloromonas sp.]MBT9523067.1 cytochrome c [Dechloromonas sp.]